MNNKKAFSFVELIVVISIIALISVIWISINNNYTERSKNSKITSDIQTLQNSLEAYKSETQTLPDPKWNGKYFDDASNYVHYDDPTAFAVAGFITDDTIPKKYLGYLPVDPRTNQYYAYAKTLTWWLYFEIAGVNVKNGVYESKVVWDYTGETGPYNLIREYNWPDFVYDSSTKNFPYNPDERIIKWKIWSMSGAIGSVKVNGIVVDNNWITNNELKAWDTIEVNAWSEAQIYYSDWSKSYLWDHDKASKLTLANMVYKDENNLFTKIQLALDYGTIWTKTSKLDPNSEFEIYTTDTEAAVRGTIFGVSKDSLSMNTKVSVQTWSVEVFKIESNTNIKDIIDTLKSNETVSTGSFSVWAVTNLTSKTITSWNWISFWEAYIYESPYITVPTLQENESLSNIQPQIKSIIPGKVVLELPSSFSGIHMKVMTWANSEITNNLQWSNNILTMTWLTGTQEIKICASIDNCTKSVSVTTTLSYSSKCELWELDFWTAWCVEQDASLVASWYTLVAYAPYNVAGDLSMYRQGGESIVLYSSGIRDSVNDNNWESFPNWCETTNSFCDIDWVKWVFIWSWTTIADYIKYTGLDSLNLWPNFAIEMSVRTPTVNNSTRYLFQLDKYKSYLSNLNYLYLQNPTTTSIYPNFDNNLDWIFHKVIATKLWNDYNLLIDWENKWTFNTGASIEFSQWLYIWNFYTWTNYLNQWNNIIDYVKVYKK